MTDVFGRVDDVPAQIAGEKPGAGVASLRCEYRACRGLGTWDGQGGAGRLEAVEVSGGTGGSPGSQDKPAAMPQRATIVPSPNDPALG